MIIIVLLIGIWATATAWSRIKEQRTYGAAISHRKIKKVKKMIQEGCDWQSLEAWLDVNMSAVNYAHMVSTKAKCKAKWLAKNQKGAN